MINYLGVDLGGTNLRIGKFSEDFELLNLVNYKTEKEKGSEQIIDKIILGINELKDNYTKSVGLCVPGQVDTKKGVLLKLTNLDLENIDFKSLILKRCGLEMVINNDANLAGLAESVFGSAKEDKIVYYITWSTGIGGAFIVNKELINGKTMSCGEIGNMIIDSKNEYQHSYMNKGGLEGIASGEALKRYALKLGYEDVGQLVSNYKNSDKDAVLIIDYVCDNVARCIANIIHVVEPDCFVFGGGVVLKSGDVLLELVKEKIDDYLMPLTKGNTVIKVASLKDEAGIYCAAYLASLIKN